MAARQALRALRLRRNLPLRHAFSEEQIVAGECAGLLVGGRLWRNFNGRTCVRVRVWLCVCVRARMC